VLWLLQVPAAFCPDSVAVAVRTRVGDLSSAESAQRSYEHRVWISELPTNRPEIWCVVWPSGRRSHLIVVVVGGGSSVVWPYRPSFMLLLGWLH
jgi:hypothetical protein